MTTYYVRKSGNDGNDGLTPATAFLTIKAAFDSLSSAGGDTIWIGAGSYYEDSIQLPNGWASENKILGDITGVNTGDPGVVLWAPYFGGVVLASCIYTAGATGDAQYLTVEDIYFFGGDSYIISGYGLSNFTARRCVFNAGGYECTGNAVYGNDSSSYARKWNFENCVFITPINRQAIRLRAYSDVASPGIDHESVIQNCLFIGGGGSTESTAILGFPPAGTGTNTGIKVLNCTFTGCQTGIGKDGSALNWESSGVIVRGCLFQNTNKPLDADSVDGGDADWNIFYVNSPRTNWNAGPNDVVVPATAGAMDFFASDLWKFPRPKGAFSPLGTDMQQVDFVNETVVAMPTTDMLGNPRPLAGSNLTAGCLEPANTATENTSPPAGSGAQSWKFTGSGIQDFEVAVDTNLTTITVEVQWDATYAGTKPSISVLNGAEAGVSVTSDVATGSSGSWETLTLSFTPTSKGIVTIRLQSSDSSGAGITDFSNYTFVG